MLGVHLQPGDHIVLHVEVETTRVITLATRQDIVHHHHGPDTGTGPGTIRHLNSSSSILNMDEIEMVLLAWEQMESSRGPTFCLISPGIFVQLLSAGVEMNHD